MEGSLPLLPANLVALYKDRDGFVVFVLSLIFLVLTLGTGLLLLFLRITFQAHRARSTVDTSGINLVFGKKLVNDSLDADYRLRLERVLQLPKRMTILLGGTTGDATFSEARAGYDFLCAKGFPKTYLHLEQSSTTTLENLRNARRLLAHDALGKAIIISNRYHLSRCRALATNLKISHTLCAAESIFVLNRETLMKCLGEAFYLHWFYCGKHWARLTRNQRMQERIS